METLLRNLRYAIRVLARTPTFTLTVVLTLALGIGANAAVFSAIDAVLLQPLTFPNADRLVLVSETREGAPISNTAPVRIEEWNEASTTFEAITGYYTEDVSETSGDLPEKYRMARVAPRFIDVWGTAPELGRGFTPAENQEGAPAVVLISHRYWSTRLDSDPSALEKQLRLGDQEFDIVGVMPESFEFPDSDVDIWTPRIYFPFVLSRNNLWYSAFGRLRPGVTLDEARADLTLIQARLAEQFPETDREVGVYLEPLKETTVGSFRASLWLLFGSVTILLLIATTNIAALLLSRAARRRQEISLRLVLGASQRSVAAQVFTETAILAVAGAVLGLLVAAAAAAALRMLAPEFPRIAEIGLNSRVLLYTSLSIVIVTLLCGLMPAIRSARGTRLGTMAAVQRTHVSGRHSLLWSFLGAQVALSVVLLAGAGLLVRSLLELSQVDPGFEPNHVLSFRVSGSYEDFDQLAFRLETILDELGALPGVEATAISAPVPGVLDDGSGFQFGLTEFEVEGRSAEGSRMLAQQRVVSPSYFETMQIPLLAGELCRPPIAEDAPLPDVMVNSVFAERYLSGLPVVGTRLRGAGSEWRIVGVVGDAREFTMDREPTPTYYACRTAYATPALAFLVRTGGPPTAVTQAVRARIKELEPLRAVFDVTPLADRIGNEYGEERLRTAALGLFAVTALSLACLGVYGTLNYIVGLRRREVGLRVALGALRSNIVSQLLAMVLRVVAVACTIGIVLSLAFSRLLSSMLYGVSPSDPLTLVGVVILVVTVAASAALLPATRASRLAPMQVLREE
jgi:putative ABC transport system permease protein